MRWSAGIAPSGIERPYPLKLQVRTGYYLITAGRRVWRERLCAAARAAHPLAATRCVWPPYTLSEDTADARVGRAR